MHMRDPDCDSCSMIPFALCGREATATSPRPPHMQGPGESYPSVAASALLGAWASSGASVGGAGRDPMGGIGASAPGPAKPTLPAYTSSRLSAAGAPDEPGIRFLGTGIDCGRSVYEDTPAADLLKRATLVEPFALRAGGGKTGGNEPLVDAPSRSDECCTLRLRALVYACSMKLAIGCDLAPPLRA
jgi:hypothetical protein